MIGQQKRTLEHCISFQPAKCLKHAETLRHKEEDEFCEPKAEDEVVDAAAPDYSPQHKVRFEDLHCPLETCCREYPEETTRDNSSSQEHSSLELCFPLHESSASSPAPNRFFQASLESLLPRKRVPIGPDHQVEVPFWDSAPGERNTDEEKLWFGQRVWPSEGLVHIDEDQIGKGRDEQCGCEDAGSIDCIRRHIDDERDKLVAELGPAYDLCGFEDMGECVSQQWTEEEERAFRELVKLNPASHGRNFWLHLAIAFPTRSKKELVSYYFNVFVLRRRALQNRIDPDNINSDDDEGDLPDTSDVEDAEDWEHTDEEESVEDVEDRPSVEDYDSGEEDSIQLEVGVLKDYEQQQDLEEAKRLSENAKESDEALKALKTGSSNYIEEHKAWRDRSEFANESFLKTDDTEMEIMRLSKALGGNEEAESWIGSLEWGKLPSSHPQGPLELASTNGAMQEFFGEATGATTAAATADSRETEVDCRTSGSRGLEKLAVEDVCS